jgi:hypothetical protein
MDRAHLRLEAARVGAWGAVMGDRGIADLPSRLPPPSTWLDKRSAELRAMPSHGAALLGYALLPWCDVTLWSVSSPSEGFSPQAPEGSRLHPPGPCGRAHAWMHVELEHIDRALAYVERLPVERGLVAKPWRWRWSSAAWHCGFGAKPLALAPEWSGPARRDLWRERLAGTFVGRSDRSVPLVDDAHRWVHPDAAIEGSAVDRLAQRACGHSPGMPPSAAGATDAMDPSQGELAVA